MYIKHKISCICIALNNDKNLLGHAIQCFQTQTYKNKELILLYTPEQSEILEFAAENNHYKKIKLTEQASDSESFWIGSLESSKKYFFEILDCEEVCIKGENGNFLSANIDGEIEEKKNCNVNEKFVLERHGEMISFRTSHGTWLSLDSNKSVHSKQWDCFKPIIKENNKIILQHWSKKDNISDNGWESLITNDVISDVVFLELHPLNSLTEGRLAELALYHTNGKFICFWETACWYSDERLQNQMDFLMFTKKPACVLGNQYLYDPSNDKAYLSIPLTEGWQNSLLCKKDDMENFGYILDKYKTGQSSFFKKTWDENKLTILEDPESIIYSINKKSPFINPWDQILAHSQLLPAKKTDTIKEKLGMTNQ